jgi:hypothetical protein
MTVRWYKGFSYLGHPNELVTVVSQQVQNRNLSQYVPVLRIERGARPRRQFYFFIAIESPGIGQVPSEVQSQLLNLQFFRSPVQGARGFTYEQIKPMVGIAHDVYAYTTQLPYNPTQVFQELNPFDLAGMPPFESTENAEARSLKYEQLLCWLSAIGSGTWDAFRRTCDVLELQEPRRILRRLKLLGHLESSANGSRWSTTPTALVVTEMQGSPEFVVCGQRSSGLIEELKQYGDLSLVDQANGDAPPCVHLRLFDSNGLPRLIEQAGKRFQILDAGRAALRLAELLPDLAVWQQGLKSLAGVLPHSYEIKRFDGNNFVDYTFHNETGLYQFWLDESDPYPRYTLFYDHESDRWLQGDWYGLRFLALHNLNTRLMARYHTATIQLAIPFSQRWVELYERPLVLASGRLPIYNNGWLIYESISPQLAYQLANQLHVNIEEEAACA